MNRLFSIKNKRGSAAQAAALLVLASLTLMTLSIPSVVPMSADHSSLGSSPWTAEADQNGANFGYSVASAGDVNNDGYDDIVVGSNNFDNGETDEGRAFLYLGSSSGPLSTPAWTAESNQAYARFGYSVSTAGDVNNDGFDDVLVGAYVYDNGESDEGRAYLYLGSSSGLSASPAWTAEGNLASAYFGSSVAGAGDINGDGFDDILVASLFYSNGESSEGAVFLYLGSSSGPSSTPSWTVEGNQAFAWLGRSVASAGDVNSDGYDDVIVGAYYYDKGEVNEGTAYLYLGSASGLSLTPAWTGESNQKDAWFGYSVSSAGDVNNDGYDDVVVGAVGHDSPDAYEGRAYLYLGAASGLAASPSWTVDGDQANAYLGVVSTAGDVNNDGFGDVLVGAYFYDNDTVDEGRVYLYTGSSSGLSATPSWTTESNQYSSMFGSTLSAAGDVNKDGFSDVIIGAYNYDGGQDNEGRAYVYFGYGTGPPPPTTFPLSLYTGWNFVSIPLVDHGYTASTLGLSFGDVVAGWNPPIQSYDRAYIVGLSPMVDDFPIEEGSGYWIYVSVSKTLTLHGIAPTGAQFKLCSVPSSGGYVDFGLLSLDETHHASDIPAMWNGTGAVMIVAGYDPMAMDYFSYIPGLPFTDFLLVPGNAYWVFCSGSGTLNYEA